MKEAQETIGLALAHLKTYPLPTQPSSFLHVGHSQYINPKVLLQAALDFAPFEEGKLNMAKSDHGNRRQEHQYHL
jgi:hypothetical protein